MDPSFEPQSAPHGVGYWFRAVTLFLIVPALLVLAAFGLQGYSGSVGTQSWPAGVASLALAASLAWMSIRLFNPSLQTFIATTTFALCVLSWAAVLP